MPCWQPVHLVVLIERVYFSKMSETSSVHSGSLASSQRLMQLALKGEWIAVEQTIKALDKGDPEIFQTDEVSFDIFYLMLQELSCLSSITGLHCHNNLNKKQKDWCHDKCSCFTRLKWSQSLWIGYNRTTSYLCYLKCLNSSSLNISLSLFVCMFVGVRVKSVYNCCEREPYGCSGEVAGDGSQPQWKNQGEPNPKIFLYKSDTVILMWKTTTITNRPTVWKYLKSTH